MADKDYTKIFLDEVLVEVPVGFAAWEKFPEKPTPLSVSVELLSDQAVWPDKRLESLIDYSRVYAYIMGWPGQPHRESLEALCEDLMAFCFENTRVDACRVRLKKYQVVANVTNSGGLGVEIFRKRATGEK